MGSKSRERRKRKSFNVNQYRTNKMHNLYNTHHNPFLSRKAGNNAMRKINLLHLEERRLSKKNLVKKRSILNRSGQPRSPTSLNKSRRVCNLIIYNHYICRLDRSQDLNEINEKNIHLVYVQNRFILR
jgi:hypothetical protein